MIRMEATLSASNSGFHTLHEIKSQPDLWASTLKEFDLGEAPSIPRAGSKASIIFTGCGSTHYLAQWAARRFQQELGVRALAAPASELFLYPEAWYAPGLQHFLIAISRSGETTETLRAVRSFSSSGGQILAITCYPESRLASWASHSVSIPAAQEESVAQTRSFTSMMLACLWTLSGEIPHGLETTMASFGSQLLENGEALAKILAADPGLKRFFFLGSGPRYGIACEAMLKMKEMSLSYAEAYHFLEFRHGPKSMVDESALVIGLLAAKADESELDVLEEMKQFGAKILVLSGHLSEEIMGVADHCLDIGSDLPSFWRDPLYLLPLQVLAYYRALHNGLSPDNPRNLDAVVILDE